MLATYAQMVALGTLAMRRGRNSSYEIREPLWDGSLSVVVFSLSDAPRAFRLPPDGGLERVDTGAMADADA